jgi:hypothetical protein
MKRTIATLAALLALAAVAAAPAEASFGFEKLDVTIANEDGSPAMGAGSHPFAMTTTVNANTEEDPELGKVPSGQPRDLSVQLPPGLVGSPDATPKCSIAEFTTLITYAGGAATLPACSDGSVVGLASLRGSAGGPLAGIAAPR